MADQPATDLLEQQMAYYRARASEYDEWFLRQGRYDHGPSANARWFGEVAKVRAALEHFRPVGDVLELAAGTGLWTEQLVHWADELTAVDASEEVLALNRQRLANQAADFAKVRYTQADLFTWRPDRAYAAVFMGFWLSHVPAERFAPFWRMVHAALKPGGRFFLVDSRYNAASTAVNHQLAGPDGDTVTRRLNDGRSFTIVKIFRQANDIQRRLANLGFAADIRTTDNFFVYGWGQRQ